MEDQQIEVYNGLNHRTGRLDRRIDDLYEHFGIHLPYEEDTDDDEDQD